jgi:hypothetical protein
MTIEKKQTVTFRPFIEMSDGRLAEQAYEGKPAHFMTFAMFIDIAKNE